MAAFHRTCDEAYPPSRATPYSAGYDLASCERATIPAGGWHAVDTGVAVRFPSDCYARIAPRSGLAFKHGIDVLAGVVDADYYPRPVKVILMNHGSNDFEIRPGDRVAQMIFERVCPVALTEDKHTTGAHGGHVGFGSTGVQ
jgi:dUTP pyrophosphatase